MIRDAVARYASRFHQLLGGTHGVASPFGAWLLLALVGPAAETPLRGQLADVLGCEVEAAFSAAAELIRNPHPEIALGSAIWHDVDVETERLLALVRRLSPPADVGPIPTQPEADAWAQQRTLGLVEKFPLQLDPSVVLVLATAIAARVSWAVPFHPAPPHSLRLPAHPDFAGVPVLVEPGTAEWRGFIDTTAGPAAGLTVRSQHGLLVTSLVGDPAADPAQLLDAAQRVSIAVATGAPPASLSLYDLALGDGPAWRISEQHADPREGLERYELLVPAWQADSHFDLLDGEFGFRAAGAALIELLRPGDYRMAARQSAMARYTREGFDAGAVTALGLRAISARADGELAPIRTARVEFTQPHAVVATTAGAADWNGLPLFSAWIAKAVPAG